MATGFRGKNQFGTFQVTENTPNLRIVAAGVAANDQEVQIADYGIYPYVFIKPQYVPICGRPYNIGRSPKTFFAHRIHSQGGTGGIYEYAVATGSGAGILPANAGKFGMRVRDASGVVTWDSRWLQPYIFDIKKCQMTEAYSYNISNNNGTPVITEGGWVGPGAYSDNYTAYPTLLIQLPDQEDNWFVSIPRGPCAYEIFPSGGPSDPYLAIVGQVVVRRIGPMTLALSWTWLSDWWLPTATGQGQFDGQNVKNLVIMVAKIR